MYIDVTTLTCANFQLSNYNFYYKYSYDQVWLVLQSARIDKGV